MTWGTNRLPQPEVRPVGCGVGPSHSGGPQSSCDAPPARQGALVSLPAGGGGAGGGWGRFGGRGSGFGAWGQAKFAHGFTVLPTKSGGDPKIQFAIPSAFVYARNAHKATLRQGKSMALRFLCDLEEVT